MSKRACSSLRGLNRRERKAQLTAERELFEHYTPTRPLLDAIRQLASKMDADPLLASTLLVEGLDEASAELIALGARAGEALERQRAMLLEDSALISASVPRAAEAADDEAEPADAEAEDAPSALYSLINWSIAVPAVWWRHLVGCRPAYLRPKDMRALAQTCRAMRQYVQREVRALLYGYRREPPSAPPTRRTDSNEHTGFRAELLRYSGKPGAERAAPRCELAVMTVRYSTPQWKYEAMLRQMLQRVDPERCALYMQYNWSKAYITLTNYTNGPLVAQFKHHVFTRIVDLICFVRCMRSRATETCTFVLMRMPGHNLTLELFFDSEQHAMDRYGVAQRLRQLHIVVSEDDYEAVVNFPLMRADDVTPPGGEEPRLKATIDDELVDRLRARMPCLSCNGHPLLSCAYPRH
jgi:hypothetical protein